VRFRTVMGIFGAAVGAAAWWWRKNPSACPYGQRFWVQAPHPIISRDRLREVLRPEPGERILEIGPGTGYYTLDLAEWVAGAPTAAEGQDGARPAGTIEIFDLQQEFLDHVMRGAAERGLANVVPVQGDATALPYDDDSMDAVVLVTVLGEIPDRATALREIARVLKPDGRLVVGELLGDPHFTSLASLKRQGAEAGLLYETHSGNRLAYFARLSPARGPVAGAQ
jgi:ubiquinone/menaquinone biosynthesis C-methylase UbiE